ncbi:hypothetical protein N9V83_00885 [Flavobacteriales bacterium]|nr:hypothetical protein [Flavobacteriales bacterium]
MEIFQSLKDRNTLLFWFGLINLFAGIFMIALSLVKPIEFGGTNAWFKPIKFALSTTALVWTVGWYSSYLEPSKSINWTNWIIIITLGFEVLYISIQAARGQASHFNNASPFYSFMYSMMGFGAVIATLAIAFIGSKFWFNAFTDLPSYYLWAIRFGFLLFVIFSFEGGIMGGNMQHSIGGPDGGNGIPFLGWSISYGDLRIAHFVGMHALQILPLLSWYVLKDTKLSISLAILYAGLAVFVLIQALKAKSFLG